MTSLPAHYLAGMYHAEIVLPCTGYRDGRFFIAGGGAGQRFTPPRDAAGIHHGQEGSIPRKEGKLRAPGVRANNTWSYNGTKAVLIWHVSPCGRVSPAVPWEFGETRQGNPSASY